MDPDDLDTIHDHDRGLAFDLNRLVNRRRALGLLAGAGLVGLVGCGSSSGSSAGSTSTSTSTTAAAGTATAADCAAIPEETAGPFPGDGSNGPDALTQSGIVRSDITRSFGTASGVAEGVPLTVDLTVTDTKSGCAPLVGAAVYVWHCNRSGEYSMYSPGVTDQNYLRGVQVADADGRVSFTSIFPAAYPGRWPHVHIEVYPNLAAATGGGKPAATTQLALPQDACETVYATSGYGASVKNLAQTPLQRDMVFSDGSSHQMAAVTGDVAGGMTAGLAIPV